MLFDAVGFPRMYIQLYLNINREKTKPALL